MKRYILIAAPIILLIATILALQGLGNKKTDETKSVVTAAVPQESELSKIQKNLAAGAMLVDVRAEEEFVSGHAVGAVNLPHVRIMEGQYPTEDKTTKLYLYCRSGKRADMALKALKTAGYTNVTSIKSLDSWVQMGGQTTKD